MNKHDAIHKLVWAIKALYQAEALTTTSGVVDHIRCARNLCWQVGEDLGVQISEQLQKTEQLN